jgi:ATP-dependent helicase/nuclease subunit A
MSLFKIFSSSAGSGKTFTLTKEYLKLVLSQEDPKYFRKVLAITFTNDAADEMKSRILKALKSFTEEGGETSFLFQLIRKELNDLNAETLKARAKAIFSNILHDYGDFSVKTIDSFINQIASAFTSDLNLPYNYEIQLDSEEILKESVDLLLEKIGTPGFEQISELVSDFIFTKLEDNKSWSLVSQELSGFSKSMLDDEKLYYLEKNKDLTVSDFRTIKKQIRAFNTKVLKQISELADTAFELIKSVGLSVESFTRGKTGPMGFYLKMAEKPEVLFFDDYDKVYNKNIQKALEEDAWLTKTAGGETVNAVDQIKGRLRDIANQILEYNKYKEKVLVLSEIERNILKIPLLEYIKTEMETLMVFRNEVFLAHFNRLILNVVVNEPVPFVFERIGERYNHLLIDEFQDTSNSQFYNLLPLLDNALGDANFNMIVGDPKQSIYMWRGGNIQLMIDLIQKNVKSLKLNKETSEIQHSQIDHVSSFTQKENLNTNFRSSKEIINFNNEVFIFLREKYQSEYPHIFEVFEDVEQLWPDTVKVGGHVSVDFMAYDKESEVVLDTLISHVKDSLTLGYDLSDIAILCRKKSEAVKVADFLKNNGYQISSADSLKLSSSVSLEFLSALLNLHHQPSDLFYRFLVLECFYKIKNIDLEAASEITQFKDLNYALFLKYFADFGFNVDLSDSNNFYALCESFVDGFKLLENKAEVPYIYCFLDICLDFYQNKSQALIDFLEKWSKIKDKTSIQSKSQSAITVTTLHKSKGLEYPVVIMPFTNWDFTPRADSEVWMDVENYDWEELISDGKKLNAAPFRLKKAFEETNLGPEVKRQNEMLFIENLNMMYVAFTRAVDRLYIYCPDSHFNKPKGVANWIGEFALSKGVSADPGSTFMVSEGSIFPKRKELKSPEEMILIPKVYEFAKKDRELLKLKAEVEFQNKYTKRGNLIHSVFENLKSASNLQEVLYLVALHNNISVEETEVLKKQILEVLNHPELKKYYTEGLDVLTEIDILGNTSELKRPDRVVFMENEVVIIDYKTGEKSITHRSQIKNYAYLFHQMGYKNLKNILVYFDPISIEIVD